MKIRSIIVAIIAVASIVVIGCQKDPLFDTTEITTKQVTSITGWSAVSGGEITSDGTPTISKRGVCWSTSPEPTMNDYTVTHPNGGLGKFSVTMDGLSEKTTYYVRAFAWNSTGAIYGEEYSFTTPYKPILSTLEAEEVTSVSAVCGGNITDDGNATVTQRGFCWSQNENPTLDDSISVVDSVGTGIFKSEITKLTPGTLYYVRAYATNAAGTAYGDVQQFTTQNIPVLKATECTDITQETAICHGDILSNAGADVTEQGFCWSTTSQPTTENEKITATAENGLGDFSITISGLQWGTTYYVRSYAVNSVGTAYGDETSFTTWTLPEVSTNSVTNITDKTIDCGGTITFDGGTPITEKGLCWSTSANPTIENAKLQITEGEETFSGTISGLADGVTYYIRAYASNVVGIKYGEEKVITTFTLPTVAPLTINYCSYTYVKFKTIPSVISDGGTPIIEKGLCWSTEANPTINNKRQKVGEGDSPNEIRNLTESTTYYVRPYAINVVGLAYGDEIAFTTLTRTEPSVKTADASNISYFSATLGGEVTNDNGKEVTETGICWSTTANPTISSNKKIVEGTSRTFTTDIVDLNDGVTYYVRAYAVNAIGIGYGEEKNFTTRKIIPPTVSTLTPSNISYTSVTLRGSVVKNNGANVTEKGFCWSTNANPSINDSKKVVSGDFSANITELSDGVTYYARAYAINSAGVGYGEVTTFTTTKITAPTVTTTAASNVSYTTVTLGGNVTAENGANVTGRGICWSTSNNPTIANSKKAVGNGTGSFTANITGLSDGTKYYVRAYATNSKGTTYGNVITFTTTKITAPTVTTTAASNISYTTVTLGGTATVGNGSTVKERGICWSTNTNPTIADSKKAVGSGAGSFSTNLTDLTDGTKYFVKAYVTYEKGTVYGEEKTFTTTKITSPTVTTTAASNVSYTTVTLGGNVTAANGATVTERGVCWSTSDNPTISNSKKAIGNGTGSFTANITGLSDGVTYYIRAYATNAKGTAYGEQITITLKKIPQGAIPFEFSISSTEKILFSKGNLQYQASTKTWRFAEHQYDRIGTANKNRSSTYSGWIDLFCWGTSGYDDYYPYTTNRPYSGKKHICGTNYDWGVYNKISNGGNQVGMWRTLDSYSWYYLIESRANASNKYGVATVNNVNGLVLLPDDWTLPTGVTFTSGASGSFAQNTYSASDWSKMEANGAVFLPAAGIYGSGVTDVGSLGKYWCCESASDAGGDKYARYMKFTSLGIDRSYGNRDFGYSVRLVYEEN